MGGPVFSPLRKWNVTLEAIFCWFFYHGQYIVFTPAIPPNYFSFYRLSFSFSFHFVFITGIKIGFTKYIKKTAFVLDLATKKKWQLSWTFYSISWLAFLENLMGKFLCSQTLFWVFFKLFTTTFYHQHFFVFSTGMIFFHGENHSWSVG